MPPATRSRHRGATVFAVVLKIIQRPPRVDFNVTRGYEVMSTVAPEAASTTGPRLVIHLFDHPNADIILRFQDSHHIQLPKNYIVNSSPILCELIQKALDSPGDANGEESLPVLQLPESGEILKYLLTFVFPVTPRTIDS